ncbi:hypothetical protein, partial [Pseudomonas sp. GW456-12-1-14-LB2]|uniref:hypothetical protein n=1 Tax=Pseudomonas sp. GW456-12-1-14-LB2 TaxID=2070606 RepID=UPI001C48B470
VLAALDELGDDRFYDKVGKVLADASPTMQDAFMTAIRVRLAEMRGRAFLERALKAKREGTAMPKAPIGSDGGH